MLWLKAFHIISMVSWFAGLFYLPRFFVYHTRHPSGATHDQFCEMERKLYRYIMNPAMVATALTGVFLAGSAWGYTGSQGWFWIKMVLVAALFGFHFWCGSTVVGFAQGKNTRPEKFFRVANEFPTLILIGSVILAVVRPL